MGKGDQAGAAPERTWLVLQRDLTVWLRNVRGPAFLTMVMDLSHRGTRAVEVGATPGESFRNALNQAAKEPLRQLKPLIPDRIQVPVELAEELRPVVPRLETEAGFRPDTIIEAVTPEEGAEWVFDDLITQMAGRQPPEEGLSQEDSIFLYEHARRFMEAGPWRRLTPDDALLVELKLGTQKMTGIVTVIGHGDVQPGLLLLPGQKRVSEMMASFTAPPLGSLIMQLEGAEGHPDVFLRARRYGWPADAALTPTFFSVRPQGAVDLDRRESWPFALVLAGVVEHFQRGDVTETWGHLDLPTGHKGRYRVRKAPEPIQKQAEGPTGTLISTKIFTDLMPDESDVQIGLMGLEPLAHFRREAEVSVAPPVPFAAGITRIPVITMTPANRDFAGVVDRLQRAKPIGATVIQRGLTAMLTILGERAGFVIMDDPRVARVWKQNIEDSDGAHVLIVTDRVTNKEEPDPQRPGAGEVGRVYGLFECVLRGGSSRAIER